MLYYLLYYPKITFFHICMINIKRKLNSEYYNMSLQITLNFHLSVSNNTIFNRKGSCSETCFPLSYYIFIFSFNRQQVLSFSLTFMSLKILTGQLLDRNSINLHLSDIFL